MTLKILSSMHRLELLIQNHPGKTQVFLDHPTLLTPYHTGTCHCFLRVKHPGFGADLPGSKILKAGETNVFPFSFIVPTQLPPQACPHDDSSQTIRNHHMMLPPSIGAPELIKSQNAPLGCLYIQECPGQIRD
jgi:hypothetical protein